MTLKFTILGCGTSGGVPRVGGGWGACDPENRKNNRRRCSLLVEKTNSEGTTTVLIDTSPDLRQQLLDTGTANIDGVLYTHDHADHTHGIDDLRWIAFNRRKRVDVYYDKRTGEILNRRFHYCFEAPEGSNYPPILEGHVITGDEPVIIKGDGGAVEAMPFLQNHGDIDSLGYRIGGLAYSPDIKGLPASSWAHLEGLDVWIVDALRYTPHPSHFSMEEALAAIDRVRPKMAVLTHMNFELDYETLKSELPDGVIPAYDGMEISLDGHIF